MSSSQTFSRQILCVIGFAMTLIDPAVSAEPEWPPQNFIDPNRSPETRSTQTDASLPFIHLEPHDFCFDIKEPLLVTIYVINLSKERLTVDWDAIASSLVFESVRTGISHRREEVPPIKEKSEIEQFNLASRTIDLKACFEIREPSVCRLHYIQPLKDGRIHYCAPVQFIVEDDAELNKIIDATWPPEHAVRPAIAEFLKANPLFVKGNGPKTYGSGNYPNTKPELTTAKWDKPLQAAVKLWQSKLPRISDQIAEADRIRAMEMILDRSMLLSDKFASLSPGDINLIARIFRPDEKWPRDERVHFYLKLMDARDYWVVWNSISHVSEHGTISQESIPALIRIADGTNKKLADHAISWLGNYERNATIIAFLRRKMTDPDQDLAVHAAIITCYSGDWSGFPMLLRHVSHESPHLREKAIGTLGDSRFRKHQEQVVPLLLERLRVEMNPSLIERTIEALQTYPSKETLEAIAPFKQHENKQVRIRTELVTKILLQELSAKDKR